MPPNELTQTKDPKAIAAAHKAVEMLVDDPHHVRQNLIMIHGAIVNNWLDIEILSAELPAILVKRLKDTTISPRERTRLAMIAEKLVNGRLGSLMRLTELQVDMMREVGDGTQVNINIVNDARRQMLEDPDYVEFLRTRASHSDNGTQSSEADSDAGSLGTSGQSTVQITEAHSSHRSEADRVGNGQDRSADDIHATETWEERVS